MPDYGLQYNTQQVISGSIFLFASGTLADSSTAISASSNQVIAITCSANFNNRLTKLTTMNANATITITSGSSDIANLQNDTKIILRYYSGSSLRSDTPIDKIPSSSDSTIDHLLGGIATNITFVNIPLLNNDDSFQVAYKTVRALTASIGHNKTFKAALVDDGSTFQITSSLGGNMKIGTSFEVRSAPTYILPNDYLLSSSGFFTITSLNSGSVATPDFSGTEVQIDGMQLGTSLMIGGGSGSQAFAHNLIQTGSGFLNQTFFQGFPLPQSASIGMQLDPQDSSSGMITGSGIGSLYLSSSGQIGLSTTSPITDVDIRADDFQIQRKGERKGLKINKEGNIESFDKSLAAATTGSEFILNYSRGVAITSILLNELLNDGNEVFDPEENAEAINFFNGLPEGLQLEILDRAESLGFISPPQTGDVMGSIRWVVESGSIDDLNKRTAGESANIKAVVADIDASGVRADLLFSVADKGGTSVQKLKLDADGNHEITGSLDVSTNLIVRGSYIVSTPLNVTGDISATGHITSSGRIQTLSHITASGNISASGDVYSKLFFASNGYRIEDSGGTSRHIITKNDDYLQIGNQNFKGIKITGSAEFHSHITASSNISASGTITATNGFGTINGGLF